MYIRYCKPSSIFIPWQIQTQFIHQVESENHNFGQAFLGVGFGVKYHFQQYFSYTMAVSFISGGKWSTRRKPPTCCTSLTNLITWCCIVYTSPLSGFELRTSVAIGTNCLGSYKSNYHTITTMTALAKNFKEDKLENVLVDTLVKKFLTDLNQIYIQI